ncbi:TRAP transporter small permease [Poseidonocella sp. HB161398]|uniref:TRAP transporter small permease n=1 Tax=Poseidonocella sp. HB161398 TaxID=2320855 RepID=UPI001109650A|nr:TRAP transporter small permease subunit [Poseidonocella sp. HB161398]
MTDRSATCHVAQDPGLARITWRFAEGVDAVIMRLTQITGILSLVGLFVAILAGVALRYLTEQGAGWVNELPYLAFPWLCASAFVLAAQAGGHICVEALQSSLPRRAATIMSLLVHVTAMLLFAWLTRAGLTVIEVTMSEFYPILRIPTAWGYGGLTVACALLSVTALTGVLRILLTGEDAIQQRRSIAAGTETEVAP